VPAPADIDAANILPIPPRRKMEVRARSGSLANRALCLYGSVLVDVREGRFENVPMATFHAIVGRFVNFAEVCGGLGKAPI
jgi:hypothetical protein